MTRTVRSEVAAETSAETVHRFDVQTVFRLEPLSDVDVRFLQLFDENHTAFRRHANHAVLVTKHKVHATVAAQTKHALHTDGDLCTKIEHCRR